MEFITVEQLLKYQQQLNKQVCQNSVAKNKGANHFGAGRGRLSPMFNDSHRPLSRTT